MSINKERIKHVITRAIASISRVSRLTGAIMRTLSIIAESIDVTVMIVARTLVNIFEGKPPKWETLVPLIIISTKVQGRHTHTKKKTKDTKKPIFICKDLISITILSLVYISVVYMKKQRIRTCYYQCSYFHLQCIQAYRYNYEIPRYYYTQHWCHSYGCWLYTRQYLWRKALNVVKSIIFTFKFHRGGIRLKPRIKNRFVHKEAKN